MSRIKYTIDSDLCKLKCGDEVWKDVVGYEGFYQISNWSRIKSLPRTVPMIDGRTYKVAEKLLKPAWNGRYFHVILSKSGKEETLLLHRLLAEAFYGKAPEGMECRHLDGNSQNNMITNLEWNTHFENMQDRKRHGTCRGAHDGEDHHNAKMKTDVVREIKIRALNGERPCDLARAYKINESNVRSIRDGKTWDHVTV